MAQRTFLGTLRLAVLLAVLAFVAIGAWLERARSRDWDATLRVTVYPFAATGDDAVRSYVAGLQPADFAAVESFFQDEAASFEVALEQPVRFRVSHAATRPPPALPPQPGPLDIALWSLRLRYFAARVERNDPLPPPDIQVFALYSPLRANAAALPDSVGLNKGLIAVAHLYADREARGSNQIVVAHEVLHTLGATDKYDRRTGRPLVPDGLGEPGLEPLFPQEFGEIMAGRIATGPDKAVMADGLEQMLVGEQTAREIGWLP
jgi:hypothetical protein